MMQSLFLSSALLIFAFVAFVNGCSKQVKSNLLVLDGVNVGETPSLLVELEAMNVPVVLAVSMTDLRAFPTVRLIAREAALRGHHVILSTTEEYNSDTKKEWSEYLGGINLKYSTRNLEYTLDLSPDHVTAIPQLIQEKIAETLSIGRIIYLNSFTVGAKGKALSAIQAYQTAGFQFISLPECIKKAQ